MVVKVGILSMHRVINYGSFLQAYALKQIIENLGAECCFIDIEPGRQLAGNEMDSPFVKKVKRVFRVGYNLMTNYRQTLLSREFGSQFRPPFADWFYQILNLDHPCTYPLDLVVIGSDEVFNCTQKSLFGFSKQLFGQGLDAKSVISYAASFGYTTFERIKRFHLEEELAHCLIGLNDISVRDVNSESLIKMLTGNKPEIHLDPVLVHDFSKEINDRGTDLKDYMVIYTYINRITDPEEINAICSFAKKHNKKLISIFCAYTWCDQYVLPETPFDVLAYFRDADYVVTDTFHGSIFSMVTKTKFCVIIRNSNREKLSWLLKKMGLEAQLLNDQAELENILMQEPNYRSVQKLIEQERKRTVDYLKVHIKIA